VNRESLDSEKGMFYFGKVDTTGNPKLQNRFKDSIRGLPTIAYFHQGQLAEVLHVQHNDAEIARWLMKKAGVRVIEHLTTVGEVAAFPQLAEIVVIAFIDHTDTGEAERAKAMKQLAHSNWPATVRFAIAKPSTLSAFKGLKDAAPNSVILVRGHAWRREIEVLPKFSTGEEVSLFVKKNVPPAEILHNLLMKQFSLMAVILGTSAHSDHANDERFVFDYCAKGVGMYFHPDVLQDAASQVWFGVEEKDLPTIAVLRVSHGKVMEMNLYKEKLLDLSKGDKHESVKRAQIWIKQFLPRTEL